MPFPPINLHTRISSPGRDLFRRKKDTFVPPPHSGLLSKPAEDTDSEREKLSMSWTSANLRNLGRKPQQHKTKVQTQSAAAGPETGEARSPWLSVPKPRESCDSVTRSSSVESRTHRDTKHSSRSSTGKEEIQFSLSLTPEAILVIQKRNLEKQMMAKQKQCCASADFRHRRVFPSKRAPGGSRSGAPAAKPEGGSDDITAIVKISLLNDQYKYDDVEYEEEDADVDETVVRKCKEWLKGVESAAAFGKVDKLASLPHLKGC